MPVSFLILIITVKLGIASPDTEIPNWAATIINWRLASDNFIWPIIIGMALCLCLTIYSIKYTNEHGLSSKVQVAFHVLTTLLANNFYFWAGNFVAYTAGSYFLDFIEPIDLQILMIFLLLAGGLAIDFFGKQLKRDVLHNPISQ